LSGFSSQLFSVHLPVRDFTEKGSLCFALPEVRKVFATSSENGSFTWSVSFSATQNNGVSWQKV